MSDISNPDKSLLNSNNTLEKYSITNSQNIITISNDNTLGSCQILVDKTSFASIKNELVNLLENARQQKKIASESNIKAIENSSKQSRQRLIDTYYSNVSQLYQNYITQLTKYDQNYIVQLEHVKQFDFNTNSKILETKFNDTEKTVNEYYHNKLKAFDFYKEQVLSATNSLRQHIDSKKNDEKYEIRKIHSDIQEKFLTNIKFRKTYKCTIKYTRFFDLFTYYDKSANIFAFTINNINSPSPSVELHIQSENDIINIDFQKLCSK